MAYDRFDRRDERPRWRDDDYDRSERGWRGDERGRHDERGFFERAGDEISSWFGDDEAERRRREDRMRDERERGFGSPRADHGREGERERFRDRGRDYRPLTGDYGRAHESEQFFAASGVGRGERGLGDYDREGDRSRTPWGRDEYRRTSSAGSPDRERDFDPHYRSWRERQMSELDRDYDEYRQENRSRFESDFGSWRERRQQKRGLLGNIREHMEVVGNDDEHVGTVDKVAGDRLILTKSDPESGGVHHSLSCSEIDRVEGDRVVLDCSADQARNRWRDESRSRALFERDDQGEMGPRMLDRSFQGTYR